VFRALQGEAGHNRAVYWAAQVLYTGLVLVPENGGDLRTLTVPDASKGEVSHRWPSALPDGRRVLFTIKKEGIKSFDEGEIAILDLDSGSWKTIIQGGSFARYLPTGQIVFARGDTIFAVPFDLSREKVLGDPIPAVNGVMTQPGSGAAQFAVAQGAGTLVFVPGGPLASRYELSWIDRKGTITPIGAPLLPYQNPVLSPDGTRVATTIFGATDVIGVYELARRSLTRLPIRGNCILVDWTPDSRQLLIGSDMEGQGKNSVFLVKADGTGQPQRVPFDIQPIFAKRVVPIPGGTGLVYFSNDDLVVSGLEGDTAFHQVNNGIRSYVHGLDVSRDGRWLVYDSGQSGGYQVYVTSFPSAGGNWQISRDGGIWPLWSPSGDEVVYYRGDINRPGLGSASWFEQGRDLWLSSIS